MRRSRSTAACATGRARRTALPASGQPTALRSYSCPAGTQWTCPLDSVSLCFSPYPSPATFSAAVSPLLCLAEFPSSQLPLPISHVFCLARLGHFCRLFVCVRAHDCPCVCVYLCVPVTVRACACVCLSMCVVARACACATIRLVFSRSVVVHTTADTTVAGLGLHPDDVVFTGSKGVYTEEGESISHPHSPKCGKP